MTTSLRIAAALLAFGTATLPAMAKIYPDDFMLTPGTDDGVMMEQADTTTAIEPLSLGSTMFSTMKTLTRGEFVAAIVNALYTPEEQVACFQELTGTDTEYTLLYNDLPVDSDVAPAVCMAMRNGWVRGYSDGTFRPHQTITTAEGAAILGRMFMVLPHATAKQPWYVPAMQTVQSMDSHFMLKPAEPFSGMQLWRTMCSIESVHTGTFGITCE
jgi:hypothetical protein